MICAKFVHFVFSASAVEICGKAATIFSTASNVEWSFARIVANSPMCVIVVIRRDFDH